MANIILTDATIKATTTTFSLLQAGENISVVSGGVVRTGATQNGKFYVDLATGTKEKPSYVRVFSKEEIMAEAGAKLTFVGRCYEGEYEGKAQLSMSGKTVVANGEKAIAKIGEKSWISYLTGTVVGDVTPDTHEGQDLIRVSVLLAGGELDGKIVEMKVFGKYGAAISEYLTEGREVETLAVRKGDFANAYKVRLGRKPADATADAEAPVADVEVTVAGEPEVLPF